jgi:hypothetical protein
MSGHRSVKFKGKKFQHIVHLNLDPCEIFVQTTVSEIP